MKRQGNQQRGASLASVLIVSVLMLTITMAVLSLGFHNMRMTDHYERQVQARALADGVLAMAISRLRIDPSFQTLESGEVVAPGNEDGDLVFVPTEESLQGTDRSGIGRLTFNPSRSSEQGWEDVPFSINNLPNDSAREEELRPGLSLPPSSAYLVAVGSCKGARVEVEAIVTIPGLPFAMGSSGTMKLDNVVIGSVRQGSDMELNLEPDKNERKLLLPANLLSNAGGGDSVKLLGSSYVAGDVIAGGDITLEVEGEETLAQVGGDLKPNHRPVELPKISIERYDTRDKPGVREVGGISSGLELEGYARSTGDLTVAGPLQLDGGILYVDGDLDIQQGVSGKGAVIVTGETKIKGEGSLVSDGKVALLSKGDLSIKGKSRGIEGTKFDGLIYTEGSFTADRMAIEGVLVSNSGDGSGSVDIKDSTFVQNDAYSELAFSIGGGEGGGGGSGGVVPGILRHQGWNFIGPAPLTEPVGGATVEERIRNRSLASFEKTEGFFGNPMQAFEGEDVSQKLSDLRRGLSTANQNMTDGYLVKMGDRYNDLYIGWNEQGQHEGRGRWDVGTGPEPGENRTYQSLIVDGEQLNLGLKPVEADKFKTYWKPANISLDEVESLGWETFRVELEEGYTSEELIARLKEIAANVGESSTLDHADGDALLATQYHKFYQKLGLQGGEPERNMMQSFQASNDFINLVSQFLLYNLDSWDPYYSGDDDAGEAGGGGASSDRRFSIKDLDLRSRAQAMELTYYDYLPVR